MKRRWGKKGKPETSYFAFTPPKAKREPWQIKPSKRKPLTPDQIEITKNLQKFSGGTLPPKVLPSGPPIHLLPKPNLPINSKVVMVERKFKKPFFERILDFGKRKLGRTPKTPYVLKKAPKKAIPITVIDSLEELQSVRKYAKQMEKQNRKSMKLSSKEVERLIDLKRRELTIKEIEREIDFVGEELHVESYKKHHYKQIRKERTRTPLLKRVKNIWTGDPLIGNTFRLFGIFGKTDKIEAKMKINNLKHTRDLEVIKLERTLAEENTRRALEIYKRMRFEGELEVLSKVKRTDLGTLEGEKEYNQARKTKISEQIQKLSTKPKETKPRKKEIETEKRTTRRVDIIEKDAFLKAVRERAKGLNTNTPGNIINAAGAFELIRFYAERGTLEEMNPAERRELNRLIVQLARHPEVQKTIASDQRLSQEYEATRIALQKIVKKAS